MSDIIMKKCKECGKMFMPRSAKQQYCDEKHYRPCPVCGKLVYAKYLSDPARRCDDCKKSKSSNISSTSIRPIKVMESLQYHEHEAKEPEVEEPKVTGIAKNNVASEFTADEILSNFVKARYIGVKTCGWVPGHVYLIQTKKSHYTYTISAIQDITENELLDITISLASIISINRNFKREV